MKKLSALSLGLTASLLIAVACSSTDDAASTATTADSGVTADASTTTSTPVSAATGGTVALADSPNDTVTIPAGALGSDTTISITKVDPATIAAKPDQVDLASTPLAFTPHGTTFTTPVTLTLSFTSTAAAGELMVMRLDNETDTTWEMVPGATFEASKATLQVSRFSIYAVGARTDSASNCGAVCPSVAACLPPENCNEGCDDARKGCFPSEWKHLTDCFATAVAAQKCQDVETCMKSEPCTQRDEHPEDHDGGMMHEGGMPMGDGGMPDATMPQEAGNPDSGPGKQEQPGKQ